MVSVNPDHLLCGLAATLDHWQPWQFVRFLSWNEWAGSDEPVPLRLDHVPMRFRTWGAESGDIGTCLRFASVPAWDAFPGGLLVLAQLDRARAPQIHADMRNSGMWMAMSVRGVEHGDLDHGGGDLWVVEVSLVSKIGEQADPGARVLATGQDAAQCWETLSGLPAPGMPTA